MKLFRSVIFWLHLLAGLIAGLVIGIMSFTGAALAFEKEIIAYAERDARRVTPPSADAQPLALDELQRRIREARPDYRPAGFVLTHDPHAAIALSAGGRGGGGGGQGGGAAAPSLYANPYTGEVREASAPRTRAFLRTMNTWHRWLGVEGEHRNIAKAATGASNLAFAFLALSGLYLWWPRSWSQRAVRAIALLDIRAAGKARDFNWHNALGLWSAPVLVVLTVTAFPISYRWAADALYTLTGTPLPAPGQGGPGGGGQNNLPAVVVPQPPADAKPLSTAALLAAAQKEIPTWETITLRPANAGGGAGGNRGERGPRPEGGARDGRESSPGTTTPTQPRSAAAPITDRPSPLASAVTITVRDSSSWPRTATTTLTLDPYTAAILRRTGYADQNAAQRVRSWTRFLHTGEALGGLGQFVAGLASLTGCVLVYTGFALAWRRFFGKRTAPISAPASS